MIAASNRDLLEEVEAGRFREDLYYRLNVITIYLPPLRERREDIRELVGHFLRVYNEENDRHVPHIDPKAMECLQAYDWPGNVRELQNYIERAVVLAPGDEITCDLLPEAVLGRKRPRIGRRRPGDLDALASELVEQGLSAAGSGEAEPLRPDRQPRRARADRPSHGRLRQRPNPSRHPPRHQPQHAAQEAGGV